MILEWYRLKKNIRPAALPVLFSYFIFSVSHNFENVSLFFLINYPFLGTVISVYMTMMNEKYHC